MPKATEINQLASAASYRAACQRLAALEAVGGAQ